jgi:hypothetical protein
MRRWALTLICGVAFAAVGGAARATDQPISGKTIKLKAAPGGTKLQFRSRDASFPFPTIGSADDPATGNPGGIVVELFTGGAPATLSVPGGLGNPGWKVVDGTVDRYVYRGTGTPLRRVVFRDGKQLQMSSDDAGVSLASPLGQIAIRITTGSLRSCALFGPATVQRDAAGVFLARDASASALSDCSDASMQAPFGSDCASLGDWPTCGGTCPPGGTCASGPGDSCTCVFAGDPCGGTLPICNGTCPTGSECQLAQPYLSDPLCACIDPTVPCGQGQPGGYCPPDSSCQAAPGGAFTCVPTFCGGTFPSCGGPCDPGRSCVPVQTGGGFQTCVCATPEFEWGGDLCGGLTCPGGEVCTIGLDLSCSCEAP